MLNKILSSMDIRDWLALAAISLFISFSGVFGVSYVAGEGYPIFDLPTELLLTGLFAILVMIGFIFLEGLYDKCLARTREKDRDSKALAVLSHMTPEWSIKSIAIFSAIMAVFWLPWYIANFPGGTYWDTYYQIYQVYPENHPIAIIPWAEIYDQTLTDAWLVDHHPVFTTMLYGIFGWTSDQLTGNWMAGVAVFCALQGIAHIVAFTASIAYMRKVGCPPVLNFIAYAFFCIMPFVSTWAMCMVKDSTFGLFFVPWFMMLFECVRTDGRSLRPTRYKVIFALLGLMLCLTKKTGIFVVVFTAIVAIVVFAVRAYRRGRPNGNRADLANPDRTIPAISHSALYAGMQIADSRPDELLTVSAMSANSPKEGLSSAIGAFAIQGIGCLAIMSLVFPYILFPALNIIPGGAQETFGPLFQQTARYVKDYGDEVTAEEREAIGEVLDYSRLKDQYFFDFEDSIKYRYNLDATSEDLREYLAVYLQQGLKHPDAYFAAIMSLAGFYVAPTAYINIRMVTVDTKMGEEQRYMLWNPKGFLSDVRTGLEKAYNAIGEIPVLDIPLLLVTYVLWIPAFLIYMLRRHRTKAGLMMAPMLVLFAFCVIAPVYDGRYIVPVFDVAPLLFCEVFVCIMNSSDAPHPHVFSSTYGIAAERAKGYVIERHREFADAGAFGRSDHGLEVGPSDDAGMHGPARGIQHSVRSEDCERPQDPRDRT